MKILICGATGFVGRHLTQALKNVGHTVSRAVRSPSEPSDLAVDFCKDTTKEIWLQRFKGISVVINAVGVLRDNHQNPMQQLHNETPVALFAACTEAKIERVIQISALGIDSGIDTLYFSSRVAAEAALHRLPTQVRWLCLRPSVIYGEDGASAQMFKFLAMLPIHSLPMGGTQTLQPVHIDDICEAVTQWLSDTDATSQTVDAVGAEATTMRGMLNSYRTQLGYKPAWHISVPSLLVRTAAKIGDWIPSSPLCSDTFIMLAAGNTAPTSRFTEILGHPPRSYKTFIP
ncbi:MAG: NAD-dependent epimerase/dehydratase family protein [Nitrosomonadaceae bacterium]